MTATIISWKTTVIFGIAGGALIGGLFGGVTSLIEWFALILTFGAVAVAKVTMVDMTMVSAAVGAGLGAVAALAAGSVARAAGANERNVLAYSIKGSLSSGISVGAGITLSVWFTPIYAVALAVVLAPAVIFILEVKHAFTYIFKHRTVPFRIVLARVLLGWCLGYVFGLLSACLIAFLVMVVLPGVATPDAVANLVGTVGPIVGAWSGGIAAIDKLISGSDTRGAIYFAIEGSTVAGVAAAFGITLSWMGLTIPGIAVATGATTLWNVTRGRGIQNKAEGVNG